ncbi:MAG: hypothetical protein AUJ75_00480 [Candidatus Omnitrophica bacterium CG1_02_49_10]|nr:MAG: hypothetical protein AUJ75_00480 [Candidatus Omnitrophica bacterium CG1_02_49_10]
MSKREKVFIYLLLMGLGVLLMDALLIRPLSSFYGKLDKNISDAEKKAARNNDFLSRKALIYGEYDKYKNAFKAVGTEEEEIASILRDIEVLANSAQLMISDVKPVPVVHTKYYNKYTIELDCEAKIDNLVKFIYDLQHSEKMLGIERLRITAKQQKGPDLEGYMLISRIVIP